MTEFKVGDRVRVTRATWASKVGGLGVVGSVSDNPLYRVDYDGGGFDWYRGEDLEPASVYKLQVPPEPPEHVTQVRPVGKTEPVFERNARGEWQSEFLGFGGLHSLLLHYPDGVEPVPAEPESEYDAALRWCKEHPGALGPNMFASTFEKRLAVIVRKVLADEPASAGPDIGTVLRELRKELRGDRVQARDELAGGRVDGIATALRRVERLIAHHPRRSGSDA